MGGTTSGHEKDRNEGGVRRLGSKNQSQKRAKAGSDLYRQQKYEEAIKQFKKAIDIRPSPSLFYDRAATYVMLQDYTRALDDIKEALRMDNKYIDAFLLEARCHMAMGKIDDAIESCNKAKCEDQNSSSASAELKICKEVKHWQTKAAESMNNGDFTRAVLCFDECVKLAKQNLEFLVAKAEACSMGQMWPEAEEISRLLSERFHSKIESRYILAHVHYYKDQHVKAFEILEDILKPPSNYQRAKETYERAKRLVQAKRLGDNESKAGNRDQALIVYSEAICIDPHHSLINSKIYCNRAHVYRQMGKVEEAIRDLCQSVQLNPAYIEAHVRRAKCYIDIGKNTEADEDYQTICQLDSTRDHSNHKTQSPSMDKRKFQKMLDCPLCYRIKAKRKKIVQEIMDTEFSYGENLIVLKEEFYEPLKEAALMKPEKLEKIFLNLDELILVNTLLRSALRAAIEQTGQDPDNDLIGVNIGSLFLDSATTFQTFERYIVHQSEAAELLERKERSKEVLKAFLNNIQLNQQRVRRMQLQSFLLVPVQRIMKYPLLLERLYNATPDSHKDKEAIKMAREKIESILREVDEKAKLVKTKPKKK